MLDRNVHSPAELVHSVRYLSEHGAYRDALVTASVWAPRFAGEFDAEQQAQLNALLERAEQAAQIDVARTNRVELDRTDLGRLEAALDELRELHDDDQASLPVRECLCTAASQWRMARDVTDRLRGELGLRPRLM